ncbi:hypothetical protein FOA52_007022 [Chlamydomonas sp. UWO 241]|nr:hypothetical protein FOA52_007022 [Chlamydomonas sp. UWO 241]
MAIVAPLMQGATGLASLGCAWQLDELALRPGKERAGVVAFLVERLLQPAALDQLLARLEELESEPQQLPEEEQQARRLVMLLRQLGIDTSPDVIRGSAGAADSLAFLHELMTLVRMRDGSVSGSSSGGTSCSDDAATAASAADPLAACVPLLDFACANFSRLTAEARTLFPSDITRAISRNMPHADALLASCASCSSSLKADTQRLHERAAALSHDAELLPDRAEWADLLAQLESALRGYLASVSTFGEVYARELGVWCESLPPVGTHGLGPRAAPLLAAYGRMAAVLSGVRAIRDVHGAVVSCSGPLACHRPDALTALAARAHREAAALAGQVAVLRTAVGLERAEGAAREAQAQEGGGAQEVDEGEAEDTPTGDGMDMD